MVVLIFDLKFWANLSLIFLIYELYSYTTKSVYSTSHTFMKNFPKTVKWAERVKILPRIRWSSAVRLKWAIDPFLLIPGSKRFSTNPMTGHWLKIEQIGLTHPDSTVNIDWLIRHIQGLQVAYFSWRDKFGGCIRLLRSILIDQTNPGVTRCIFLLMRWIRGSRLTLHKLCSDSIQTATRERCYCPSEVFNNSFWTTHAFEGVFVLYFNLDDYIMEVESRAQQRYVYYF